MRFPSWDRRTQFVIDSQLQRRLIVSATLPVFVVLVLLLPVQLYLDMQLAKELAKHDLELNELVSRPTTTLLFFVFAVGYVLLVSLRLSHRIAGAAYRIRRTLEAYRSGDHEVRARLRQGDLLTGLADDVNSFLDWSLEPPTAPPGVCSRDPGPAASEPEMPRKSTRSSAPAAQDS